MVQEIIKPTIGRKVYYLPNIHNRDDGTVQGTDIAMVQMRVNGGKLQPFDATIIFVWSDTCVNLKVIDHAGNTFTRPSVMINSGDGVLPRAEWMDYQKGQAAKTEQLEAQLQGKASVQLEPKLARSPKS